MLRHPLTAAVGLALVAACAAPSNKPALPEKVVGHCSYTNRFSNTPECREYRGDWTDAAATADCEKARSAVVLGAGCEIEEVLGYCLINKPNAAMRVTFPGSDPTQCGTMRSGCEVFAGGYFDPAPTCGGDDNTGTGLPTFQQPVRRCVAPKEGEPAGLSEGGQVCTWEMISGCTEPGRLFSDYASCEVVRTQRPYYAAPEDDHAKTVDPRLEDPAYVTELEWVKSQVRASACICCHADQAPNGASNWNVDAPGNFANGFHPRGLAMGAGWIDTVGFGAFAPEHNNGFVRPTPGDENKSIFPTTDSERMIRFWLGELEARKLTREQFVDAPPGAGPLDEQRFFRPSACTGGEGVAADGTITWRYGAARYLYVLEASANSPTVPPNLDLPEGTLWRVDVPGASGTTMASKGVKYGVPPAGAVQKFPASAAPAPLVSGREYYLYVLADIAIPTTRCLFKAP
jgi:hypothetical protein